MQTVDFREGSAWHDLILLGLIILAPFVSLEKYHLSLENTTKILARSTLVKEMLLIFLGEFAIISQLNLPTKPQAFFLWSKFTPPKTHKKRKHTISHHRLFWRAYPGISPAPEHSSSASNSWLLKNLKMPCHGGSWYQDTTSFHGETVLGGWHSLWLLRCNFVDVDC